MAKRKQHIVQDERGQDQPSSKNAAHRTEPTMPKDAGTLDPRDIRDGVYDPVNEQGEPRFDQVADVRPDPNLSHQEPDLPEGLRRPRTASSGPTKGRG
jgi:hypothetical protein